jgi:hypothetical protein
MHVNCQLHAALPLGTHQPKRAGWFQSWSRPQGGRRENLSPVREYQSKLARLSGRSQSLN